MTVNEAIQIMTNEIVIVLADNKTAIYRRRTERIG